MAAREAEEGDSILELMKVRVRSPTSIRVLLHPELVEHHQYPHRKPYCCPVSPLAVLTYFPRLAHIPSFAGQSQRRHCATRLHEIAERPRTPRSESQLQSSENAGALAAIPPQTKPPFHLVGRLSSRKGRHGEVDRASRIRLVSTKVTCGPSRSPFLLLCSLIAFSRSDSFTPRSSSLLPPELFDYILDLVFLSDDSLEESSRLSLVSSFFVPFVRTRLFKSVDISSADELSQFIVIVKTSPVVAEYMRELASSFESDDEDEGRPKTKQVLMLLSKLNNVEVLAFEHCARLAKAFLSNARRSRHLLPALEHLVLHDSFWDWRNPFDPAHFVHLRRHPQLKHLSLDVDRTPGSIEILPLSTREIVFESEQCWRVDLSGPLCGNPAVTDLLFAFPAGGCHFLHPTDASASISGTLLNVPLYALFLSFPSPPYPDTFLGLAFVLKRSTYLKALSFGSHAFQPHLVPALLSVPDLAALFFECECGLTGSDAKSLLADRDKLPNLRTFDVEHLECRNDEDACTPLWTDEFTREDTMEVMRLCEERGVTLGGFVGEYVQKEGREEEEEEEEEESEGEEASV